MKVKKGVNIVHAFFLMSIILISLACFFYVGSLGSDDMSYIDNAITIASGREYIPKSHWGFRYTLIIPLSITLRFFELTEQNIFIFNLIINMFLLGYLFFLTNKLSHTANQKVNIYYIALIFATCPFLVIQLSILNVDLIEANLITAVILNIAIFITCGTINYLYIASFIAGLCLITRETSILYITAILIAFIASNPKIKPKEYFICIFIGSFFVISESIYYLINTGDAFYHIKTTFHSHLHNDFGDIYKKHGEDTGNILSNTSYEPITVLFINQEFGIIFYLFVIYMASCIKNKLQAYQRFFIALFFLAFILISFSGVVRLLPRYYYALCLTVIIMTSMNFKLNTLLHKKSILIGAIAVNLLSLSVENVHPIFHHKIYLTETNKLQSCIKTESNLVSRAFALSTFPEYNGRFLTKECSSNYYYVIEGEDKNFLSTHDKSDYDIIQNINPPMLLIGHILEALRLKNHLPQSVFEKLAYRNHHATVIKIKG